MVSKRCCPSCRNLVKELQFQKLIDLKVPFVFPGSHSVWTAVTLPPCLPQDFGKELIKSAKAKLRKRFEKIVLSLQTGQSNPRKRSISVATDVPGQAEE